MDFKEINKEQLEKLSPEERKIALEILEQYASKGSSNLFNELVYSDYEEIPVDILTFIDDPNYLGNGTMSEGKSTVFPYWRDTLKKIFPDNLNTAYNSLILTGGIGLGKSFIAVICILYMLYRMICLKDPYKHYGLQKIDVITFAFMNITLHAAEGVAWSKCQELLKSSPWFMNKGHMSRSKDDPVWVAPKGIELIFGSTPEHVIGRCLFACFEDEISFQRNQDVEKQKEKAKTLISSIDARMKSRFMKGENLPTLNILASSKRTEQSFLESFIEQKRKNESKTTLIIDEPQWVIRTDKDTPNKFLVAVGNKFLASEVLPLNVTNEVVEEYKTKGYTIIKVPMGYYENFIDDIDIALTDIAGISTTNTTKYISGVRWNECVSNKIENPMTKEVIEVGNARDDTTQYYDFFDLKKVPSELKNKPLFIHLDMSLTGDKTGIAGVWIKGKRPSGENEPQSKTLYYQLAFSFAVKAPKGYQISFEKNKNFIYWLREQGFSIKHITADTYQSAAVLQDLKAHNFECDILSVDRVENNSKICLPYQYFKATIYEKNIEMYKTALLTEEAINLERDGNGRIDHPMGGTVGCFVGSTLIRLVDGRTLTMKELVDEYEKGKTNWVYSFNENTQKIEPKPIERAWLTIKNAPLVKVVLDNDREIVCTPNHRFMLRDDTYVEAKDLKKYDSLMPLYTKVATKGLKGYRLFYEPMEDSWHWEHRKFAKEIDDEKYLVHHKNCNPLDNTPPNLIWCSKSKHHKIHQELCTGASSPEANKKRSESIKKWHADNKGTEAYALRNHKLALASMGVSEEEWKVIQKRKEEEQEIYKQHLQEITNEKTQKLIEKELRKKEIETLFNIDDWDKLTPREKDSYSVKYNRLKNPDVQERISLGISKAHKEGKFKKAELALRSYNESMRGKKRSPEDIEKMREGIKNSTRVVSDETRKKLGAITSRKRWYNNGVTNIYIDKDEKVPDGHKHGRIKTWKNHKVKSVEFLNYVEDVYDLTIKDNHNFALDAGVFVHNSKDIVDALAGATFTASKYAEEYAYDYGEDYDVTLAMNNADDPVVQGTAKKQMIIDFENELKNLNPLKDVFSNSKNTNQDNDDFSYISNDSVIW